jgi:type IV fimbrial biogenesis protein FimT
MNRQKSAGYTLLEAMIIVAIIGILAAIAVPSYQDTLERNRLKQVVESLKSDLQFARTEAIKSSQDVVVSRTTGSAGTWCYGLNVAASCNCATAGSCSIKTVAGSAFSTKVSMDSASGNSTFDYRRGTIGANGVTFSTANYKARVVFSDVGRVRICTPAGSTGIPAYPAC